MSCQIGKHFSIICKAVWFIIRFFTMPFVKFNLIRFETCLFKTTLKCSSSKINDKIIILSRIILKSVHILLKELNILLAQIFLQRHLSWFLNKLGVIPRPIAHNFSFAKILVFCKSETHLSFDLHKLYSQKMLKEIHVPSKTLSQDGGTGEYWFLISVKLGWWMRTVMSARQQQQVE